MLNGQVSRQGAGLAIGATLAAGVLAGGRQENEPE